MTCAGLRPAVPIPHSIRTFVVVVALRVPAQPNGIFTYSGSQTATPPNRAVHTRLAPTPPPTVYITFTPSVEGTAAAAGRRRAAGAQEPQQNSLQPTVFGFVFCHL
eukprot:3879684-Prymnesium_polylepis.2